MKTAGRLRILSIASMFPNPRMPVHAQFVKQRVDAVARIADVTVVSPIPWFPGDRWVARYVNRSQVPAATDVNHYPTFFPKFLSIPAILKPLDGVFLALAVYRFIIKHDLRDRIDVLDCHLAYPEGFAGALLSSLLHKPYVVTLRGHDINELHRHPVRGRQVLYALRHCARYFGVAQALVDGAVRLGAPREKGFASTNGVDAERFYPTDKVTARKALGLDPTRRYLLSVSHLVPRKGVDILISALGLLRAAGHSDLNLIVVGKGGEEGDCENELRQLVGQLGLQDAVHFSGAVLNPDLHTYYSAADVFCLASEKEGWPNVILEALACCTPVAAFATWGVPEIIKGPHLGVLIDKREPQAFAEGIAATLAREFKADGLRAYAVENSWQKVAEGLITHFKAVASEKR